MTTSILKRILPGAIVHYKNSPATVIDIINSRQLVIDTNEGKREAVKVSDLVLHQSEDDPLPVDLAKIGEAAWQEAIQSFELIRPLIEMGKGGRSRADVDAVARKAGKHCATIYRWLEDYERTGLVSSLLRKKRNDSGKHRINSEVEAILSETIEKFHLTHQRRTPTKTAEEVRKICIQKGLNPPDEKTVRNRINKLAGELVLRRREGAKAASEKFRPLRGSFPGAEFPLSVVQIDHTPMDVIVVDEIHRKPINRPYLTVAVDVYSRMVVGFYISLDHPGAFATGMCISRAILGKEMYLNKLGIEDITWPCWGVMRTIHTDNAKEFRGTLLGRATEQYGILRERRPKGRPNFGGHIERLFRTHMEEIHNEIPGTTFSNVKHKREYDSEGRAVMTLDALEYWFCLFVLGVYHQKQHSGISDLPPIKKWELGIRGDHDTLGTGIPMRVTDEERLQLDFMPYFERTVQEYGVQNEGVTYWCDAIRRLVHIKDPQRPSQKKQFVCRYDPRDISRVWLFDDESRQYIEIPYRNLSRPQISIWELRQAKAKLRQHAKSVTNEVLIFKTIDQMRELVMNEAHKTKSARRMQQRRLQWKSGISQKKESGSKLLTSETELHDDILDNLPPFDFIRES